MINLKQALLGAAAFTLLACAGIGVGLRAQNPEGESLLTFEWKKIPMDGHRAGIGIVTTDNADSLDRIFGVFKGKTYVAPNGKKYKKGITPQVARILMDAQPAMAPFRTPLGYAPESMVRQAPECALFNMYVDQLMACVADSCGKKIDVGFANSGGVRCDLKQGKIGQMDVLAMFPFKSNVCCFLEVAGKDLMATYERMAAHPELMIQGGAKLVYTADHKLKSVEIDGKPLDPKKIYNVATINFILNGGDGFNIARNAKSLTFYKVTMSDFMMEYYKRLTAEGKEITYQTDGRITQL